MLPTTNGILDSPRQVDPVTIRENKLSLVERLADDLAHEIKNPLHSMVINLEVLRRRIARLDDDSSPELLRYAGVLNVELERVNRRVDLLLRLVRPNQDGDDPATLAEILEELRELVELECDRREVHLRMDDPPVSFRSRLPRSSASQMIIGLILDTLDSIPRGGTLQVTSGSTSGVVEIRVDAVSTDGLAPTHGTAGHEGPSLSVAYALAERLGGKLEVKPSRPGPSRMPGNHISGFVLRLPREGAAST
jgi:two-component system, NtrC family, sensor histidine kinase HydH